MAIKTYNQQLEEVQTAITTILENAQSVSINGRSYEYGDLETLYKMEQRLRVLADRETNSGGGIKVTNITPS